MIDAQKFAPLTQIDLQKQSDSMFSLQHKINQVTGEIGDLKLPRSQVKRQGQLGDSPGKKCASTAHLKKQRERGR